MRYSVLLPTHDRADVVGYALESVLYQTEPDFEVLVVGDGCTDDTAAVVQGFEDPRIRWFDLPKGDGFGYANRNLALREARGDLVAFVAHDDLLLDDHLEIMAKPFESPEAEWAYSRPLWVDDTGIIVPFAVDLRRPDAFDHFMDVANAIPASCVVYRRQCLEDYGYWPEDMVMTGDLDLWRRMLRPSGGANLAYVPIPTCLHFRAGWRPREVWGPAPLGEWLDQATSGWWPDGLRRPVPGGTDPQASIWAEVRDDPTAWRERVRAATVDVIDGFAWGAGLDARHLADERANSRALQAEATEQTRSLERALAMSNRQLTATELHARELDQQLAIMASSTSWRVTQPLRAVGRSVRHVVRALRAARSSRRRAREAKRDE